MAETRWTPPQAEAISARGGHVLCAAAAGAGKTAVLAERVVGLLADPEHPLDVDQLLIVTFTRAAAAEMRRRIGLRLRERARESARLQRQSWLLPQADITTLHGFCERTLRRNFAAAGCDPAYTVLDPGDAELLRRQCLDELLEERYAGRGPDPLAFADMVDRYGGRRLDEGLRPLALRLHEFARSLEDPAGWLTRQEELIAESASGEALLAAQRVLHRARGRALQGVSLAAQPGGPGGYLPALEADVAVLEGLLAGSGSGWDALAHALPGVSWQRLPPAGQDADPVVKERVQNLRDRTKDEVGRLAAGPYGRPLADHAGETAAVAAHLRPLLGIVRDLDARYAEAKQRLGAMDFGELEHRCLALLQGPEASTIVGRYREVLVDEAQDLSPIQDGLLEALCRQSTLFCVGDARQSIYGFRLAEPRRFLARAAAYAEGAAGRRIGLPHNFRSRSAVIFGVNFLFDRLFGARGSDLPPGEAGPLIPGAIYGSEDPPLELHLVNAHADADEEASALEREAKQVADLVVRWLGERPDARPGEVAVLLRALSGAGGVYLDALRARGLPAWAPSGGGRMDGPEGRAVLSWLRVLDNPQQDIPLAATLRGPFGGFSDAELAEIRAAAGGDFWNCLRADALRGGTRATQWLAALDRWRTEARHGGFGALLAGALRATGYLAAVGALPGGAERRRTLEWLVERCRQADRFSAMDLTRLIAFLEGEGSGETVAEAAAAAGDAVKVLSVHGSKGLEFPMVVVAGLGRRFNLRDRQGDVLAHREAGIGARAVDLDRRVKWPTLRHAAVAERLEADARAEELRVLYVALTRARERLALVGSVPLEERAAEWLALAGQTPDLGDGVCALDWIGPVVAGHPDVARALGGQTGGGEAPTHRWEVHVVGRREVPAEALGPEVAAAREAGVPDGAQGTEGAAATDQVPATEQAVLARLDAEADWAYPGAALEGLAAKATVGELRDRAGAGPDEEPGVEVDASPPPPLPRPRWASGERKVTPVEAGSATHLVLRHLDLTGACDQAAVEACAADLVRRELLEAPLAVAVNGEAVARFLRGGLGRRLRAAGADGRVRREVPFAMRLPAAEVHGIEAAREWVLVQGVIDALVVEGEGLWIVDYKTDHGDVLAAAEHYRAQVGLYAQAAASAWRRPVREAWLCFLTAGRDVPVILEG